MSTYPISVCRCCYLTRIPRWAYEWSLWDRHPLISSSKVKTGRTWRWAASRTRRMLWCVLPSRRGLFRSFHSYPRFEVTTSTTTSTMSKVWKYPRLLKQPVAWMKMLGWMYPLFYLLRQVALGNRWIDSFLCTINADSNSHLCPRAVYFTCEMDKNFEDGLFSCFVILDLYWNKNVTHHTHTTTLP